MANWLNQLQSLLGQQGASSTGESSKGSALLPGAIGGLAGLLVASKSSRKLLAKYGTSALLAGGGAVGRWRVRCYGTSISRRCALKTRLSPGRTRRLPCRRTLIRVACD